MFYTFKFQFEVISGNQKYRKECHAEGIVRLSILSRLKFRTKFAIGAQKIDKIEIFEKIEFFKILFKIHIKLIKNRLILNKNFPSRRQVEAALWDSRPSASNGHASGMNLLLLIFFFQAFQNG